MVGSRQGFMKLQACRKICNWLFQAFAFGENNLQPTTSPIWSKQRPTVDQLVHVQTKELNEGWREIPVSAGGKSQIGRWNIAVEKSRKTKGKTSSMLSLTSNQLKVRYSRFLELSQSMLHQNNRRRKHHSVCVVFLPITVQVI